MDIFAITCLVVLILAGQHLINWFWRRDEFTDDAGGVTFVFIVSLVVLGLTYWGVLLILDWGCQIN